MVNQKRVEWVDLAKGITILLVLFGHAVQGIIDSNNLTLDSNNSSLVIVKQLIYGFHMPLFFFLSALFTGFLYRSYKVVIKQKFKRLLIPYFIWSLITATFMQLASRYTNTGLGLKNFLMSPIIPFSEYWFLYVLFVIYLIYALFGTIFKQKTKLIILVVSVILLIVEPFAPNFWILIKICQNLFFFALGTYFFNIVHRLKI